MAFGNFDEHGSGAPMSEINTTPMVDVMLVLLIIFMVTAPLMTQSVDVDLPRAASVGPSPDAPKISLSIDADGALRWDGAVLVESELAPRMENAAALVPQPALHLQADRQTRYEQIARVLATARAAGLHSVGFVTLPERAN